MIRTPLCILLLHFAISSVAQDIQRVHEYIDTLTSPYLHGRGYVSKGDSLAAAYLSDRFKEIGLTPFKNSSQSYLQKFNLDINTFPGALELSINDKKLEAGKDYILNPASGGGCGKLKALSLDSSFFSNDAKQTKFLNLKIEKYALVVHSSFIQKMEEFPETFRKKIINSGAIIELTDKKLTASLSSKQYPLPWFVVRQEVFPSKAKQVCLKVEAKLIKKYSSQNVIGYVKGQIQSDTFLVISAHYDHLGRMGKDIYFPGANDNASGISMLLELATYYSKNPSDYSIAFMAFGAEEAGLIGSRFYTEHPLFPLSQIKFLVNLDLLGTGEEGITVVNATLFPVAFNLLDSINQKENLLTAIKKRGPAPNSDHYYFTQKGVPAFFIYTMGGIAAYHDIYDLPETLPLSKFNEVFTLLVNFLEKL